MNKIIKNTNEKLPKAYILYGLACFIYAAIRFVSFSDNDICNIIEIIAMIALVIISAILYISRKKAGKTGQLSNLCIIAMFSIVIVLYDVIKM